MLPILFELSTAPAARALLRQGCAAAGALWAAEWAASDLGPGLVRVRVLVPEREPSYVALLDTLCALDMFDRSQAYYPSVYDALYYVEEPIGLEIWASTAALFARGYGDCEDLSCDRAAELALSGIPARAVLDFEGSNGANDFYHVVCETPAGIEDPSAALLR